MRLTLSEALIATLVTAALMYLLRAFPFILFSRKKPPKVLSFIEKYIPAIAGVLLTIILHLWKGNSMISIFGGTILFMVLERLL